MTWKVTRGASVLDPHSTCSSVRCPGLTVLWWESLLPSSVGLDPLRGWVGDVGALGALCPLMRCLPVTPLTVVAADRAPWGEGALPAGPGAAAFPWTASSVCAAVTVCLSDGRQSERRGLLCVRSACLPLIRETSASAWPSPQTSGGMGCLVWFPPRLRGSAEGFVFRSLFTT